MAAFKKFTDIQAWQKARILTKEIYLRTNVGEVKKDFALANYLKS